MRGCAQACLCSCPAAPPRHRAHTLPYTVQGVRPPGGRTAIEASHGTCRRRGLFRPGACSCAPSSTCSARHLLHSRPDRARHLTHRTVPCGACGVSSSSNLGVGQCASSRTCVDRIAFAGFGMIFIRTTNDRPVRSVRTVFVSFRFTFTLQLGLPYLHGALPSGHPTGRGAALKSRYFSPQRSGPGLVLESYARCAHVSDVVRVLTLWLRSRSRVHRPGIRSRDTPRCRVRVRGRGGGACRVPLFDPTTSTSGAAPLPRAYDEHYVPARGQLLTSPSAARERDMQAHSSLETKIHKCDQCAET